MFKKLFLFSMVVGFELFSINLRLLDGTTQVLSESELAYAPFHGVPYAESISENLFQISVKDIKINIGRVINDSKDSTDEITEAKKRLEKFLENISQAGTLDLVGQMFHRAGGQFQLTAAPDNPVRQLSPKNIGEIFKIISEAQRFSVALSALAEVTSSKKEKKDLLAKHSVVAAKELLNLELKLESYLEELGLKDGSGKEFKRKKFRPFVRSLIKSFQESDKNNPQALFVPGTTEGILLGYMLRRCHTKKDLASYLEGFMGKKVTLSEEEYSTEDIDRILGQGVQLDNVQAFGDWLTCAFYQKNYRSGLPKIIGGADVLFHGNSFPDCVETTIRNLCNIATYNGSNLGITPSDIELHHSLRNFYQTEKANMPSEVSNKVVYQAWVDVIENMPGILYGRVTGIDNNQTVFSPVEYEGFMPIDETLISDQDLAKLPVKDVLIGNQKYQLHEKTVGTAKYLLVPKNSNLACYEVMPTASNIVVALNNLFNLKLYEQKDIFDPTFAQQNFQKVCNRLGWSLQTSSIDNTKSIRINICKGLSCFAIHLDNPAHGHIDVTKDTFSSIINRDIFSRISYENDTKKVSEIVPLMNGDSFSMLDLFNLLGKNPEKFAQLLKTIDVGNPNRKVEVIKELLNLNLGNSEVDNYISRLIILLPTNDPHYIQQVIGSFKNNSVIIQNSIKRVLDLFILQRDINNILKIMKILIKQKILTADDKDTIILFVQKRMASSDKYTVRETLGFIQDVIKEKILTADDKNIIMSFVQKGMASSDEYIVDVTLGFIQDVIKEKIFTADDKNTIMSFLEKRMASSNENTKTGTLDIIKELIKEKILTADDKNTIMSFVQKGMASSSKYNVNKALGIIKELIKEKIFTDSDKSTIISFVQKRMASSNEDTVRETLGFIQNVIKEKILTAGDKGTIMSFVQKGMASSDHYTVCETLGLIQELIKEKILTADDKNTIMSFVEKGMASSNGYNDNVYKVLDIIQESIKEKILTAGDITADDKNIIMSFVQKGMESSNKYNVNKALGIIKELIKEKILTADDKNRIMHGVEQLMNSDDLEIFPLARSLYEQLKEKDVLSGRGMLSSTRRQLMRHDPYAGNVTSYIPKQYGMSSEEFSEKFKDQVQKDRAYLLQMEQQGELDDLYRAPNLDELRKEFEKQEWQVPQEQYYQDRNEDRMGKNDQVSQRLAEQASVAIIKPKASNLAKGALARAVRASIRK
jgi:hypothetical protein